MFWVTGVLITCMYRNKNAFQSKAHLLLADRMSNTYNLTLILKHDLIWSKLVIPKMTFLGQLVQNLLPKTDRHADRQAHADIHYENITYSLGLLQLFDFSSDIWRLTINLATWRSGRRTWAWILIINRESIFPQSKALGVTSPDTGMSWICGIKHCMMKLSSTQT